MEEKQFREGEELPRQSGSKGWQNIRHMRVDVQTQSKIMSLIASLMLDAVS